MAQHPQDESFLFLRAGVMLTSQQPDRLAPSMHSPFSPNSSKNPHGPPMCHAQMSPPRRFYPRLEPCEEGHREEQVENVATTGSSLRVLDDIQPGMAFHPGPPPGPSLANVGSGPSNIGSMFMTLANPATSYPFVQRSTAVPSPESIAQPPSWALAGSLDPTTGVFYRTSEHARQRTAQACEKCRIRKAKCSGTYPSCQRCLSRALICEYSQESRMSRVNKRKGKNQDIASEKRVPPSRKRIFDNVSARRPPELPHADLRYHDGGMNASFSGSSNGQSSRDILPVELEPTRRPRAPFLLQMPMMGLSVAIQGSSTHLDVTRRSSRRHVPAHASIYDQNLRLPIPEGDVSPISDDPCEHRIDEHMTAPIPYSPSCYHHVEASGPQSQASMSNPRSWSSWTLDGNSASTASSPTTPSSSSYCNEDWMGVHDPYVGPIHMERDAGGPIQVLRGYDGPLVVVDSADLDLRGTRGDEERSANCGSKRTLLSRQQGSAGHANSV